MATWTLTFGVYADPSFVGMKGVMHRSAPLVDGAGAVSQQTWTVVIANDGTGTLAGLPFNDDGSTYYLEWQLLAWKDSPRNKTFQVLSSSGVTIVDYDGLPSAPTTTVAPAGVPFVTSVNGHAGVVKDSDLGIGASFVVHGTNASVARPTTTMSVIWYGSVDPVNADDALDVWIPVSADGGADSLASLQAALAAKADLAAGVVPDSELPARLQDAALRAAYVLPKVGGYTYNTDGTVASGPDGETYAYNTDGTVHSVTLNGVTRVYTYNTDGTVAGAA